MVHLPIALEAGPGEESVWDYPRPPRLEHVGKPVQVVFGGTLIVDAAECFRVLETSHPPVYYISPVFIARGVLRPVQGSSLCEWKGRADYFDVVANGKVAPRAAWRYAAPTGNFAPITGLSRSTPVQWIDAPLVDKASRRSRAAFTAAGLRLASLVPSRANPARMAGNPPPARWQSYQGSGRPE